MYKEKECMCGKLHKNPRFCSSSCAAKHNNSKRILIPKPKKINICRLCGKDTTNKYYCDNKCQGRHLQQITENNIEHSGISTSVQAARRYLTNKHGHKCSICSITEWQNRSIVFVIDHINGDPADNSIINLRLICPNCDSQTDTYKGKNKGNGRYSRRIRFQEDKSF